jgi:CTP synthase
MLEEKLDLIVLEKLGLDAGSEPELKPWKDFLSKLSNPKTVVDVALIGKYVELPDAYKSIAESFIHAGAVHDCKVNVHWIHSESITEQNVKKKLENCCGIVVAPGFGHRGIDGKLQAVKHARENNIPFLGICLGMQCAVIEFARHVLKLSDAHSTEMDDKTTNPVIDLMAEQKNILDLGGTMRLGLYPCQVNENSNAFEAYGTTEIQERHRHRYEFNNAFLDSFIKAGMVPSGINRETGLVEIVEIPSHRWFVGAQFHPEYKSTVINPHPLFVAFIKNALEYRNETKK